LFHFHRKIFSKGMTFHLHCNIPITMISFTLYCLIPHIPNAPQQSSTWPTEPCVWTLLRIAYCKHQSSAHPLAMILCSKQTHTAMIFFSTRTYFLVLFLSFVLVVFLHLGRIHWSPTLALSCMAMQFSARTQRTTCFKAEMSIKVQLLFMDMNATCWVQNS
jgi:hypothetical protein